MPSVHSIEDNAIVYYCFQYKFGHVAVLVRESWHCSVVYCIYKITLVILVKMFLKWKSELI